MAFSADAWQECVDYRWAENVLTLRHRNATFNCCTDKSAYAGVEVGFIEIHEYENTDLCLCNCFFDLDFEIDDLPAGIYSIQVFYGASWELTFAFEVDLAAEPAGTWCREESGDTP